MLNFWFWTSQLDRLREEQRPEARPFILFPIPLAKPPPGWEPPTPEPEPPRVIIIDF